MTRLCLSLCMIGLVSAATPFPPKACDACAGWNRPQKPFRIYGDTWYVGTAGLSSVLIHSPRGAILIDAGLPHPEIAKKTKEAIRQARSDKTGQPYFRPEFLNRISEVVIFRPLTPAALRQIAVNEVTELVKLVRDTQGVVLESADGDWSRLAGWLCRRAAGDHKQGRAIAAQLRAAVVNPLASGGLPADRLSTVRAADQILVLEAGKVVAHGTHEGLLESSPLYRDTYALQLQTDDEASGERSQIEEHVAAIVEGAPS